MATNDTLSGNDASFGGGIFNDSSATFRSTIIANNSPGENCTNRFGTVNDGGYNIQDGGGCGFSASTSKTGTDPKLDPGGLKDNGGPTQTIALQSSSPAIDQIPNGANGCGTDVKTDQRGAMRPVDGDGQALCDVGAFEFGAKPPGGSGGGGGGGGVPPLPPGPPPPPPGPPPPPPPGHHKHHGGGHHHKHKGHHHKHGGGGVNQ